MFSEAADWQRALIDAHLWLLWYFIACGFIQWSLSSYHAGFALCYRSTLLSPRWRVHVHAWSQQTMHIHAAGDDGSASYNNSATTCCVLFHLISKNHLIVKKSESSRVCQPAAIEKSRIASTPSPELGANDQREMIQWRNDSCFRFLGL